MFRNPLEERGGRVCNARNTFFSKKKFSPRTTCPQRVHVLCPHTGCTQVWHMSWNLCAINQP